MSKDLGSNWHHIGSVEDVGKIVDGTHLYALVPMTEDDRLAYVKSIATDPNVFDNEDRDAILAGTSVAFINYICDIETEGDPRIATHWLIDVTIPEGIDECTADERKSITWWDMGIWSCVIVDGDIYGYAPEFSYSWWQATYTEGQVYAIVDAMKELAIDGTLANNHDRVWSEVWNRPGWYDGNRSK